MSEQVLDFFAGVTTVPVVVIDDVRHALPLGRALAAGGIPCAEITLRTPSGLAAVEALAALPGFRVGAGTVLDEKQARAAVDAGADFLVSPGFDDGVWRVGRETGVPVVPGTTTATEVQRAVNAGAGLVKFFPAVAAGGIPALRALSEPFGAVRFMPTGGVRPDDASAWLAEPAVLAVGGSWLAPRDLLRAGRFDEITRIARATTRDVVTRT
ncbi:bifunctional 4-hydroxy-2-oxoglutarate aldolase/2-dehydro-3-deoxy-phosphogluconate aldolase [Streptomyces sp. NPDC048282]|uniref:bifunctional 4-hydroxy-2-oxoglutarate aldolase/2-dehydro-3-deoxy-phosphogluconate aldolase n=1 Tax=Streptomyces sp. NPDC048282 TaxID=3365528 RepID=UPI00371ECF63